jgi:hypothetical protein
MQERIKGQTFLIWKQAPGELDKQGYKKVFLPYFQSSDLKKPNKAVAYSYNGIDNNTIWKYYELEDNEIKVRTKLKRYEKMPKEGLHVRVKGKPIFDNISGQEWKPNSANIPAEAYKLNAIHTFATARIVVNMYLRALLRLDKEGKLTEGTDKKYQSWEDFQWSHQRPLLILIDENYNSAIYSPEHQIHLGKANDKTFNCRYFDYLSHEVGHAILHSLVEFGGKDKDVRILHESFADLTTVFSLLSMMDVCEQVISSTKGKLKSRNPLLFIGDTREVGTETEGETVSRGLILLENLADKPHHTNREDTHHTSLKITNAVCNCLIDFFHLHQDIEKYEPAESLFRVGRQLLDIFLYAIFKMDKRIQKKEIFPNLQEKMLEYFEHFPLDDLAYQQKLKAKIKHNIKLDGEW